MRIKILFLYLAFISSAHLVMGRVAMAEPLPYKLVMFETKGCRYCKIFTKKVLPDFQMSRLSFKVPFEDVDMDKQGLGGYKLKYRVLSTPTFTMLNRGKEVGRITGYLPKKKFFRAVRYLLRKAKKAERKYQRQQSELLYSAHRAKAGSQTKRRR